MPTKNSFSATCCTSVSCTRPLCPRWWKTNYQKQKILDRYSERSKVGFPLLLAFLNGATSKTYHLVCTATTDLKVVSLVVTLPRGVYVLYALGHTRLQLDGRLIHTCGLLTIIWFPLEKKTKETVSLRARSRLDQTGDEERRYRTRRGMSTPVFVLKPCKPGYKEMKLFPGTTTLGRSSKTRIKSRFVSRKHVELLVEMRTCKIRYLGKHTSEVKVNDESVEKEWVEFPLGGRLELMADPKEAFPYTLEPYSKKVLGVVPESSVQAVDVEQYQDFTGRFNCPICTDLFVEPTELDCKHLFCFKCISDVLIQAGCNNKCPSCQSKITPKRKSTILAQRGNKRSRTEGATKYQSQAVGLVKDTIQWLVERRMCDYSDESEWRRRSGLDPLPKLASATTSAPSIGSSGSGGQVGGCPYALGSDETSEVINLLSDSEGD